ncbi:MAG: hypothetical protein N3E41_05190 [Thermofilaceae archaeon]|nr:hypothetical protein [Thermofilaceae archaeon]MDW8003968.1 hypothetical protein [Thermofilaceae archaeon]
MKTLWKQSVLTEMGLTPISLSARDWLLLLLQANDQNPIQGEESIHITFFMMQYPPVDFKPLVLSVFSQPLYDALEQLINEGLVEKSFSQERGKIIETFKLSDRGVREAELLYEKVRKSWVIIGDLVARDGSKLLGELEALKKTYNGKDLLEWLRIFMERIDSPESSFDIFFTKAESDYMKKLYRVYRRTLDLRHF